MDIDPLSNCPNLHWETRKNIDSIHCQNLQKNALKEKREGLEMLERQNLAKRKTLFIMLLPILYSLSISQTE